MGKGREGRESGRMWRGERGRGGGWWRTGILRANQFRREGTQGKVISVGGHKKKEWECDGCASVLVRVLGMSGGYYTSHTTRMCKMTAFPSYLLYIVNVHQSRCIKRSSSNAFICVIIILSKTDSSELARFLRVNVPRR